MKRNIVFQGQLLILMLIILGLIIIIMYIVDKFNSIVNRNGWHVSNNIEFIVS